MRKRTIGILLGMAMLAFASGRVSTAIDSVYAAEESDTSDDEEDEDEEETYRIVTTVREDVLHGLISIDSPVGKALLGHRVGDTVHVQVNDKYGYDVEIRKIDKTTDETDDKIRDF